MSEQAEYDAVAQLVRDNPDFFNAWARAILKADAEYAAALARTGAEVVS